MSVIDRIELGPLSDKVVALALEKMAQLQIGALQVPPGGVLVVQVKSALPDQAFDRLAALARDTFSQIGCRVVVIDHAIELAVVTADQAEKLAPAQLGQGGAG